MKIIINYFNTSIWTIISFLLVIFLILIPLASFLSYSFFTVDGLEINHEFSLANYREFFVDEIYINTFVRTIYLALIVMFSCILLGYPVAYFLARYAGKYKYAILLMLIIPLFMSYIIKIYMMRSILGYSGLINKTLKMFGFIEKPLEFFLWNHRGHWFHHEYGSSTPFFYREFNKVTMFFQYRRRHGYRFYHLSLQ